MNTVYMKCMFSLLLFSRIKFNEIAKNCTTKAKVIKYPIFQTIFCYISMQACGIFYYYLQCISSKLPDHKSTVQFQVYSCIQGALKSLLFHYFTAA